MKKFIPIIVVALIAFFLYGMFKGKYNSMVKTRNKTEKVWADVETQYQRRADLIPNLVNVVKGYAAHEKDVLVGVTEARAKASSMNIDASNLNEQSLQQFQAAQGQLNSALSRLLVTIEKYPDLKADQRFAELQAQLEGTENRIAVARNRYNDAALEYKNLVETFPNNLIANMFGFKPMPLFKSEKGSEKAPTVEF